MYCCWVQQIHISTYSLWLKQLNDKLFNYQSNWLTTTLIISLPFKLFIKQKCWAFICSSFSNVRIYTLLFIVLNLISPGFELLVRHKKQFEDHLHIYRDFIGTIRWLINLSIDRINLQQFWELINCYSCLIKEKRQIHSGSSVSYVKICCLSVLYIILNWISLSFGLFFWTKQNIQLGFSKLVMGIFLTFQRLNNRNNQQTN